jgi:hypothetical protein
MVGAMLITLIALGGFVGFRALNRTDLEVRPEPVDYLAVAGRAQDEALRPVYPRELPDGWIANSAEASPLARNPAWGMGMLTGQDRFVGIQQGNQSLDSLLATFVDESPEPAGEIEVSGSVAARWQVFVDDAGDTAYAAEVGEENVIVYGSAPKSDLLSVLALLTQDDLP